MLPFGSSQRVGSRAAGRRNVGVIKGATIQKGSKPRICMVKIPDFLHRRVKSEAALDKKNLSEVFAEALALWLDHRK